MARMAPETLAAAHSPQLRSGLQSPGRPPGPRRGQERGRRGHDLDLTESALRQWVERARADRTGGRTGLTTAERDELVKLRKENRELRLRRLF